MRSFTIQQYKNAGCSIGEGMERAYTITGGKMCATRCAKFKNGACSAHKVLTTGDPAFGETVRHEAQRLDISIGEVRRRRNEVRAAKGIYTQFIGQLKRKEASHA